MTFMQQELVYWGFWTLAPILAALLLSIRAVRQNYWRWYREGLFSLFLVGVGLACVPPLSFYIQWFMYPEYR